MTFAERTQVYVTDSKPIIAPYDQPTGLLCKNCNRAIISLVMDTSATLFVLCY